MTTRSHDGTLAGLTVAEVREIVEGLQFDSPLGDVTVVQVRDNREPKPVIFFEHTR